MPQKVKVDNSTIDAELDAIKANVYSWDPADIHKQLKRIEQQAKKAGYHVGVVRTSQMYAWVHWTLNATSDEVIRLYEKAQALALKHGDRKGFALSKFNVARAKFTLSIDRDEWLPALYDVLEIAREEKDRRLELTSLSLLASVLGAMGEVSRGYSIFKEALAIAEELGDPESILRTIVEGASSLAASALFEAPLRKAYELSMIETITPYYRALAQIKYAMMLHHTERPLEADAAIEQLRTLLPSLPLAKQGEYYTYIGSIYIDRGEELRGIPDLEKILTLEALPFCVLYAYAELGRIYSKADPQKALSYFSSALKFSEQYQDPRQAPLLHKYLADFYRMQGDLEKASVEFAVYEQLTEVNREISEKQMGEYADIILRFDKQEEEKKRLTQEVEVKSTALTEKSMLLAEQTELMANFRDELRSILRRVETQDPAINDIRKKLRELPEAVNWKEFDTQFQSVHPQFIRQLEEKYPDLTKSERKLCVLFRLNLTSRDVSKLLSLSVRTVEHHRSSIRKKLAITPEEDIARFLGQI